MTRDGATTRMCVRDRGGQTPAALGFLESRPPMETTTHHRGEVGRCRLIDRGWVHVIDAAPGADGRKKFYVLTPTGKSAIAGRR